MNVYLRLKLCSILESKAQYVIFNTQPERFVTSNKRNDLTPAAKRLASLNFVVDRFHFSGHTDSWCKLNCNPDMFEALKKVHLYTYKVCSYI